MPCDDACPNSTRPRVIDALCSGAGLEYFKEKHSERERKKVPALTVHSAWEEEKTDGVEETTAHAADPLGEMHGAYFDYVHKNVDIKTADHARFLKAKKDLAKHQQNKVSLVSGR